MKSLLPLSCGDGPQTNFSCGSLAGETGPSTAKRDALNLNVRSLNSSVVRHRSACETDSGGFFSQSCKATSREPSQTLVVTGNPRSPLLLRCTNIRPRKRPSAVTYLLLKCPLRPLSSVPAARRNYTTALPKATRHGFSRGLAYRVRASPEQQLPDLSSNDLAPPPVKEAATHRRKALTSLHNAEKRRGAGTLMCCFQIPAI